MDRRPVSHTGRWSVTRRVMCLAVPLVVMSVVMPAPAVIVALAVVLAFPAMAIRQCRRRQGQREGSQGKCDGHHAFHVSLLFAKNATPVYAGPTEPHLNGNSRMLKLIEHGPVHEIRMDRPPVNALNPELVDRLRESLETAGREADGVVLSGRDGMFSAGLDVPALLALDRAGMGAFWQSFEALLRTIACMPVPTAAAITGHSPAGGAVMALFADYRVMSRGQYRIGLNETQVGLSLPGFIHHALVRLVGDHRAERMIVSGALLSPEQAQGFQLVDALEDDAGATVTAAVNWCTELLRLPRQTMRANRAAMRRSLTTLFEQDNDEAAFLSVWFSDETQATLRALAAKLGKG